MVVVLLALVVALAVWGVRKEARKLRALPNVEPIVFWASKPSDISSADWWRPRSTAASALGLRASQVDPRWPVRQLGSAMLDADDLVWHCARRGCLTRLYDDVIAAQPQTVAELLAALIRSPYACLGTRDGR